MPGSLDADFHRAHAPRGPEYDRLTDCGPRAQLSGLRHRRAQAEGRLDDTFSEDSGYPFTFGGAILLRILHDEGHRTEIVHNLARLGVPDLAQVEVGYALWDFVRRGFG